MIRSMTGFGSGQYIDNGLQFTVEIKTVNHRYNDILIKKPKHINYVDENIRKLVKNNIKNPPIIGPM